jgi:hypothetical protein
MVSTRFAIHFLDFCAPSKMECAYLSVLFIGDAIALLIDLIVALGWKKLQYQVF